MTDMLTRWPQEQQLLVAPFDDHIEEPLVCVAISQVTHDVKSFVLRPHQPRSFVFEAGQYVTVTVPVGTHSLERCYTISSAPLDSDSLTITVKRASGGPVSNWLHDHLRVGDSLQVSGPLGLFTHAHRPAAKYLFLSAGSGITPLMSMTRTTHALRSDSDVVFVHSARTPDDIIFREELAQMASQNPRIRVTTICEGDSAREHWRGPRGRLSTSMLQSIAPDLAQRDIYLCGPPAYMAALRTMLAEAGVDPARCHEESFLFGEVADPVLTPPPLTCTDDTGVQTFSVTFARSALTVPCGSGTTILQAAARAGLSLPSSCAEGMCGTCKTTMVTGSVEMEHAGGIRPREIAQNKVLLCCSTPCEDLVIDA